MKPRMRKAVVVVPKGPYLSMLEYIRQFDKLNNLKPVTYQEELK